MYDSFPYDYIGRVPLFEMAMVTILFSFKFAIITPLFSMRSIDSNFKNQELRRLLRDLELRNMVHPANLPTCMRLKDWSRIVLLRREKTDRGVITENMISI